MTLRTRLALTYGAVLAVGLIVFAIVSVVTIDRTLRAGLDARLSTAAHAAVVLTDIHDGRVHIDVDDRKQLRAVFENGMHGAVVDRDGAVVEGSPDVPTFAVPPGIGSRSDVAAFDAGSHDAEVRIVALPIRDRASGAVVGAALTWRPNDWIDEFDRSAIIGMSIVTVILLGLALLVSGVLARRALSPLKRMSDLATEIEGHAISRRLHVVGSDELATLCAAFDRMLDRLEEAFARQRRFTADASHELRAPLAVIRAEADLALRKDRDTSAYRSALQAIADETDRLEELVELLLSAARADAAAREVRNVDLRALVDEAAERLNVGARAKSVVMRVDGPEHVSARVDADGVSRALTAVLHNAIAWTPADGAIAISASERDGAPEIAVRDSGPGFSAQALEHALERFWRGDPSRRRGSSGLGLAIAQALVAASGGNIILENAEAGGAVVRMRFSAERRSR